MKGSKMGSPDMRVHFNQGSMAMDVQIDLSSAPNWIVNGELRMANVQLTVDEGVKGHLKAPLKSAAEKLMASPIGFSYRFPGPIRFDSKLGNVVGDAFRSALSSAAQVEQKKLEERWMASLQKRLGSELDDSVVSNLLGDQFPKWSQSLSGGVQSLLGFQKEGEGDLNALNQRGQGIEQLLADALGLKGGREGLQSQLKDRLKQEATRRAQSLIQEKLSGKKSGSSEKIDLKKEGLNLLFGGKKSSDSKTSGSKDKKEETERKDPLKEVLKGFPF
jgi:hypothetical protein